MYFKQIELAGFKSFADRIEINFDSGITAIVGPNGCGKSNVGDAIRWVLGEQSSKNLRGTSMQDVIFNGTEKRKSLSYCEATLIFDNTDRFFDFDFDELAITRKLYRSGESEYLLNRTPCRLKDIVNILYDSGIGKDGYSIIGQGKVDEIINAKPENRRGIFEDAAGISKFKSRKVEAERKLERTRDNLTRLKDILSEVERQLGPLKKQAENAKKYLEFKGQLKDHEVNAYIYQYENTNEIKAKISEKLNAILEEYNLRQNDLQQATKKYADAMNEINNIDVKIDNFHAQILSLSIGIEKQSSEIQLMRERINHLNIQNDKISLDLQNNEKFIDKSKDELSYKQNLIKDKQADIEALNKSYQEISNEYLKIIDEIALSEDEVQSTQKNMLDTMDKIADIKSNISKYKTEKEYLESQIKDFDREIKELKNKVDIENVNKKDIETSLENASVEKDRYAREYATNKFKIDSITSNIEDEENDKSSLNAKIQVYENRHKLLLEWQAEYEGYAHSVKKLLREGQKNTQISNKMVGVLASLIKVPEKYETAIEIALGNAVQNIVTYNEKDAKELIEFLKQNQYGRATFMPITTMKPRHISSDDLAKLKVSGCYGVASDLISYDKNINSVISNLLGSTIVVDNLDTALKIANNSHFSYKIVTLDGDVVNPQGSLTGGSKKSGTVNLISREREIETITTQIEKLKMEFELKTKNIKDLKLALEDAKNQTNNLAELKNQAEIKYATEYEKLQNINNIINSLQAEFLNVERERQLVISKINLIEENLASVDNLENDANASRSSVDALIEQRQKKSLGLNEKREQLNQNLTTIKVALASAESEINSLTADIERLNEDIISREAMSTGYQDELMRNSDIIEQAELMIKEKIDTETTNEAKDKLANIKSEQEKLEERKVSLQGSLAVLDERKNTLLEDINKLTDRKYNQESQLTKVDTDLENMKEKIYEEYELTYETCQEFKRPDYDVAEGYKEIAYLKKEISKLGYVNVNAIEESKLVMERYESLNEQTTDLEKAESELTQIIKELSSEMEIRFKTEFDKINNNFKVTFRELFGGGNASLELTDEDNLLEAGVDIVAEPPGKKLQNISLLSGGEKALTAIAILFSILKLKPLPFCLLDEIEAALDDANVERFAQYLHRFSSNTQFIVITHRKPTMELADSLYGVTMEEKGVSKMVSVKLSDAVKAVEDN